MFLLPAMNVSQMHFAGCCSGGEFIFFYNLCQSLHKNPASYLAALTGADAVVVARGLVLTHKARLICARRWRRRGRTGEHVVWAGAGAGGLAADGCRGEEAERGKVRHLGNNNPSAGFITATFVLVFADWISLNMNLNNVSNLPTTATCLHHGRTT